MKRKVEIYLIGDALKITSLNLVQELELAGYDVTVKAPTKDELAEMIADEVCFELAGDCRLIVLVYSELLDQQYLEQLQDAFETLNFGAEVFGFASGMSTADMVVAIKESEIETAIYLEVALMSLNGNQIVPLETWLIARHHQSLFAENEIWQAFINGDSRVSAMRALVIMDRAPLNTIPKIQTSMFLASPWVEGESICWIETEEPGEHTVYFLVSNVLFDKEPKHLAASVFNALMPPSFPGMSVRFAEGKL